MKTKMFNLLIIPLIACGLIVSSSPIIAAPASTLYFNSASNTVANGSNFSMNVMINPGTNSLTAVALKISYDASKIVLDSITPSSTFSLVLANANINNNNGTASIDLGVPTTNPSVSAVSSVAILNFRAVAAATNSLVSFNGSQAAAEGENADVLTSKIGSMVTINPVDIVPPIVQPIAAPAPVAKKSSSSKDDKKETKPRTISNSKKTIARGAVLAQRGKKFSKKSIVLLYFSKVGGGYYAPAKVMSSSNGSFLVNYRVNKPVGTYSWYAIDSKTGKKSKTVYYKVK